MAALLVGERVHSVTAALSCIFFVSGCAALLFESLWFRQALLAFGSSVWASSLVLSSFMAGVALGNGGAARFGRRVRRPVLAYAWLELVIGVLGIALVVSLPRLGPLLGPLLGPMVENAAAAIQPLRFALSFVLLLGPAAAMGATLPLLVAALSRRPEDFGRTLGALYGWNTLGAVCGALAGEAYLISELGVVGTGGVAGGLNLLAAVGALTLCRSKTGIAALRVQAAAPAPATGLIPGRAVRLLAASFLSGAILLALEVVWCRLLLLFVAGTTLSFALMLAIVLAGIAVGSLAASVWVRGAPAADRYVWSMACVAGAVGIVGYGQLGLPLPEEGGSQFAIFSHSGLALAAILMMPVAVASGVLFTLIGKALNDSLLVPVRSAGLLALVNTLGAALGPMLAGFIFLPHLGVELSIFLLCASYGVVAVLCAEGAALRAARWAGLPALVFLGVVLAFPFGRMDATYLPLATKHLLWPGSEIVARREGLTETVQYSRLSFLGEPVLHQLLTNGHSMSASGPAARRYMTLFVYLPVAFHPGPRDALLISYGIGTTAKALTRVEGIQSLDIVDISREILEMSEVVFSDPAENPLRDPRVSVHVEDGRYFLQTTGKSFDLITGEPPPPRLGNVAYLYTQEYFQLTYDRLRPGGMISYWLPVFQLSREEAASITGAFCAVFEDCSMWNGSGLNWILLGSRGGIAPPGRDALARQWRNETTASDLRAIGVETLESLGSLFIADAEQLGSLTDLAPPVRDAFPLRIHNRASADATDYFVAFRDSTACRARLLGSAWMRRIWPEELRRETLRQMRLTALFDRSFGVLAVNSEVGRLNLLRKVLESSELETLPLLFLSGDPRMLEIAASKSVEMADSAEIELQLANGALSRRSWREAATHYRRAAALGTETGRSRHLAVYAYCRAGEQVEVLALRREIFDSGPNRSVPREMIRHRGIDGCWAAAWDPDWP